MQAFLFLFGLLAILVMVVSMGCTPKNIDSTPSPIAAEETNSSIVTQAGLIGTFPTDEVTLIDKKEVLDSLRNEKAASTLHEVEYVSDTAVTDLYGKFKTELTGKGWTEQNPQTQSVGAIHVANGTFVKGSNTVTVAVQTAVGEEKQQGATQVKLVVELVN